MLHQMGVKVVIISSSVLGPNGFLTAFGSSSKHNFLNIYIHTSKILQFFIKLVICMLYICLSFLFFPLFFFSSEGADSTEVWKLDIPRLPHLFTGTGDLFSVRICFVSIV